MTPESDMNINRRAWLAGCARHALLGGVTLAAGILVCRGQVRACGHPALACVSCQELARCTLPRAAEARVQPASKEND
ncbi:MAG: hypothetical protein ACYC6N_23875 [Pirellulaceae bacterium]